MISENKWVCLNWMRAQARARTYVSKATVLCMLFVLPVCSFAESKSPYDMVHPLIGTANEGQTYPVVGMPFGMTGWTAETQATEAKCISPYYYKDTRITGFRGSHWLSGSCTQDYGTVTLMPTTGTLKVSPSARSSSFRHETETATPAYYSILLDDYSIKAELTGTLRTSIFRFTFPENQDANIIIQPNAKPGEGFVRVRADRNEIVGYNPVHRLYLRAGEPAGFNGYFVVRFPHPFSVSGTWCGDTVQQRKMEQNGGCERLGAFASFAHLRERSLLVKVGTSFTSIEEAEKNLDAEDIGWNFEAIRKSAESAWRKLLDRIEVSGGTPEQQITFYTALFHASLAPRIVSDADGTYNGFAQEGKLHHTVPDSPYYDDFSLWDTFRALHPLLTILDPPREEQMVQSLIAKGEQGGFLPIFPTWNSYTSEMIGDHAIPVIVDAYAKGLRHFDVDSAYRLILKNATITPSEDLYKDGRGRRALNSYLRFGYIPLEDQILDAFHQKEQVSRTLEYAYDDFVAAEFAGLLHKDAEEKILRVRAENWRNVLDPVTGFVRGRHENGQWDQPFQPDKSYSYVTEGLPWQYTFFVPHNVPGLITAMGGKERFITALDGLFERKLYDQGNEPSHHIAYLYAYADAAWKTQMRVRDVMAESFHDGPGGLPGNDDAGQMSAWYVFSAMGFYPVCPGRAEYVLGSPIFSRVVIHQANGRDFTIMAPESSEENKYIVSATLNGHPYTSIVITHADIVNGATLLLKMSSEPNGVGLQANSSN